MDEENYWDAGNLGCGELLLKLKMKLSKLPSESSFRLHTLDLGAIEDLPAWAKLTGHTLVSAKHPEYIIRTRK